jgi:hypothetical protein
MGRSPTVATGSSTLTAARSGVRGPASGTRREVPVLAQVTGVELDNATLAQVVAVPGSAQRPVAIDRARIEPQMRDLALEHAAGRLADAGYLGQMGELRSQLAAIDEGSDPGVPADRALAWLRAIGETWQHAGLPEAKADLLHAIYERDRRRGRNDRLSSSHAVRLCARTRARTPPGCYGAPDRCWARDSNLHDPDRGPG